MDTYLALYTGHPQDSASELNPKAGYSRTQVGGTSLAHLWNVADGSVLNTTALNFIREQGLLINPVVRIEEDMGTTLFLRANGDLWGWGNNADGQLGLGDTVTRDYPVPIALADGDRAWDGHGFKIRDFSVGGSHCMFIANDSANAGDYTVWVMGNNNRGQLGVGDNDDRHTPVRAGRNANGTTAGHDTYYGDAFKVSAGYQHSAFTAEKSSTSQLRSLYTMGRGTEGQLGLFSAYAPEQPVTHTEYIDENEVNIAWTPVAFIPGTVPKVDQIACGGAYWSSIIGGDPAGYGHTLFSTIEYPGSYLPPSRYTPDLPGAGSTTSPCTTGPSWVVLYCRSMGHNANGQLGLGDTTNRAMPTIFSFNNPDWPGVLGSHGGSCESLNYDWNNPQPNYFMCNLRAGGAHSAASPQPGGQDDVDVYGTFWTPWTWGGNADGQLGHGDTDDRLVPTMISGLTGVGWAEHPTDPWYHWWWGPVEGAIECGGYHTLFVSGDTLPENINHPSWGSSPWSASTANYRNPYEVTGKIIGCGLNNYGQLGVGNTTTPVLSPIPALDPGGSGVWPDQYGGWGQISAGTYTSHYVGSTGAEDVAYPVLPSGVDGGNIWGMGWGQMNVGVGCGAGYISTPCCGFGEDLITVSGWSLMDAEDGGNMIASGVFPELITIYPESTRPFDGDRKLEIPQDKMEITFK